MGFERRPGAVETTRSHPGPSRTEVTETPSYGHEQEGAAQRLKGLDAWA